MAVQNSLVKKQNQRLGLTAYLTQDAVKNQINSIIGGKDGQKFIASIVSAVNTNPTLQCTNQVFYQQPFWRVIKSFHHPTVRTLLYGAI